MRLEFATIVAVFLLLVFSAEAGTLPKPTGEVLLTVTGDISNTNADQAAEFDLSMLDNLASRTTVTKTPWYDGSRSFSGPLLASVMKAVGAHGTAIRLRAINDYAAEVPFQDATDYPVILATRVNGTLMSVREKGPAIFIYPFDERPELNTEEYFSRCVWQITKIEIF